MAIVRPFSGVRYNLEKVLLKSVIAPPYDVISDEMKAELQDRSPFNVVNLILPEGEDEKYKNAAKLYKEWRENGVLKSDKKHSFYLYEQVYEFGGKEYVRSGFIGLLKLEELGKGSVYPHEKTLAGPKKDRFELMKACKTNFSQVFGLYMDKDNRLTPVFNEIKKAMPVASAVDDGQVKNTLWAVDEKKTIDCIEEFMKDKAIYIADGHHRYETALNYRNHMREQNNDVDGEVKPYDYIMMMFVNFYDEGLKIFPTHRAVEVEDDFDMNAFLKKLENDFEVEKLSGEEEAFKYLENVNDSKSTVMFHDENFYAVSLSDDVYETLHTVYRTVDTYVLQETILTGAMGIDEERILRKEGIYFVQSMEVIRKHAKDKNIIAFLLKGVDIEGVRNISENGLVMPQKSTYFYPKLETGLVINEI